MNKTLLFVLLLLLLAVGAWFFFFRQPEPVQEVQSVQLPPAIPVETKQPEKTPEPSVSYPVQEPVPVPVPEPEPEIIPEPRPLLNESDPEFGEALSGMVDPVALCEYLVRDQVISRLVSTIDSLTARQVPRQINPVKPADDKFIVESQGDRFVMSAKNFARYDGYVTLLSGLSTEMLMSTYQRFYPLFQEAWEQNGQEGSFNDRLLEVIDSLMDTPDVPGPVYLTKPEAVYVFEEPELESLPAGQKILIRMGSVNASVVKDKLEEIKAGL
jgi:hypothetical protein